MAESRQHAESGQSEDQRICHEQKPLELHILVSELYEVTDWFHFGLYLRLPPATLKTIKKDTVGDHELGKTKMLEAWRNHEGSDGSWKDIVAALMKIRMRGLAERLARKYGVPLPQSEDGAGQH